MSYSSELNAYIKQAQYRLRFGAWLRGTAVFAGTALAVTLGLVLILNRLAFPARGVTFGRVALILALASAAIFGLAIPLVRLTRAWAVRRAEAANPELEQRLATFHEREGRHGDPFLELLAADALAHAQNLQPASLVPQNRLLAFAGSGAACLGILIWLITASPGYIGYGASLLWTGGNQSAAPLYAITVQPGDITVRRNADQLITARIKGMHPEKAQLLARYASASGWEPVAMQPVPGPATSAGFQFVFAGLPESVEYYVAAGPLVSPHYKVRVVDLPSVKDVRVTYKYPVWTGLKSLTEEHSGDLRAIEGTEARIELEMDRPLKDGQLTLDSGETTQLTGGENNLYRGTISMTKDGAYHVSAMDEGQAVRLSDDYFIATDKAMPPEVSIARPGGDYRASPIEEVTVGVKGADEFGLRDLHLHYSVNGGPDRDVNLLETPGAKTADGSHILSLEDFKLKPGDLISIYATAKDGHSEARTDISFIEVDPFEREFSQSQQAGGAGGGGGNAGNQTEISKREKELIAATWKQENEKAATAKDAAAQGQFLSDAQQKLRDQVNALSVRMQSRDISEANSEFTEFDKDMQDAAAAMAPSADKLRSMQWKDALPLEQKALQALLRAEATFRQIEVAFGQAGGGSGGGNAGRDLASLFDLELDTEKNQYETTQSSSPAEQHDKDVEDALQKLDALAKRQEDLANQQHNPQQSFEQRWQQEMLRREAEQLQRQLEQMAQNRPQSANGSSSGQSSAQQNSSQNKETQESSASQNGSASSPTRNGSTNSPSQSPDERIEQALSRLRQATGEMRSRDNAPGQNADAARQAAEALREAQNLLAGAQQQVASGKVDSFAHEANRLKEQERSQADRINKLANSQDDQEEPNPPDLQAMLARRQERDQLAGERQQLSDSLSKLQQKLRDAEQEMSSNQPGVAQKLRDALTEMDDSDLDNRVQRTADWLRRGINPNSSGTESDIAQGLNKLSEQLQQAQRGMAQQKPASNGTASRDQTALLNQVEKLREQLESMADGQNGRAQRGTNRDQQQNGAQQFATSNLRRSGNAGANGRDLSGQQSTGATDNSGQSQQGQRADNGARSSGDLGNQMRGGASGDVRYGGGQPADDTVWNNINTGNNRYAQRAHMHDAPTDANGNPADSERVFGQEMRELRQLRQMTHGDPETEKDVAELTRQMQHLDPSRFPGNPAMVEQMHREVLNSLNRLELELQIGGAAPEARTGKPNAVPAGYQDAVADYYKRLSKPR